MLAFSFPDADGNMEGFDFDYCRAVAVAALGDAEAAVAGAEGKPPAPAPQGDRPTTSVKQMAVALGDNPALLDDFIALEKDRTGGARKTAVKLFLGTELAKAEDTREEVIADLQALLQ